MPCKWDLAPQLWSSSFVNKDVPWNESSRGNSSTRRSLHEAVRYQIRKKKRLGEEDPKGTGANDRPASVQKPTMWAIWRYSGTHRRLRRRKVHVGRPENREPRAVRARGITTCWTAPGHNKGPYVRDVTKPQECQCSPMVRQVPGHVQRRTVALEIAIRALGLTGEVIVPRDFRGYGARAASGRKLRRYS